MNKSRAIWADPRILFLTLGACTVAAAIGLLLLQNHSASSYHKSIETNELAALASAMTRDTWAVHAALLNSDTPRGTDVTSAPDLQAASESLQARFQEYRTHSPGHGPSEVMTLLDPIIADIEQAFLFLDHNRLTAALPLLKDASSRLEAVQPEIERHAEHFEMQADKACQLTTYTSIGVFGAALVAMGVIIGLYFRTRRKIEVAEAEQETLRRSEAHFRPLVQNSADLIAVFDENLAIAYLSPSCERKLGYSLEELSLLKAGALVHADDADEFGAFLAALSTSPLHSSMTISIRVHDRDGRELYLEVVGTNLLADPDVRGIVFNCRDVTDRHAVEEQLRHQAFHDSLTQLSNRLHFSERLEHALVRGRQDQRGGAFSVLIMDLDRFKNVNDDFGHSVGDALLQEVARRLLTCVRPSDTSARLGGDEFAILLDGTGSADGATLVAERILAAMNRPLEIEGHYLRLSASIGIVVVDPHSTTSEEVMRRADLAMYDAKQNERGSAEVYQPSMHDKLVERLRLTNDLQSAVDSNEFLVYYQPVIDLRSQRINGFEALARWEHPTRGILPPSDFIALAEEMGVIHALGENILYAACRKAAQWNAECLDGGNLSISVNVSPRQLEKPGFTQVVERVIAETGIDASLLVLEITETAFTSSATEMAVTVAELKELGVRIALDDFGTGFSSLDSLSHFPIDVLKIDRSFTQQLGQTDKGRLLVQMVIDLGAMLNIQIVAEGIERYDQLERLNVLRCHSGQGYLFARPLGEAAADDLVAHHFSERTPFRCLPADAELVLDVA